MDRKTVVSLLAYLLLFDGFLQADLLDEMRHNDAKFDNVRIVFKQSYVKTVRPDPFHFIKFGDDPSRMPKDYWEPRKFKMDNDCWFMVHGEDSVWSIQFNPEPVGKYNYNDITRQYHKYGALSGVYYQMHDSQLPEGDSGKKTPNYEKQLTISKLKSPLYGLYDRRREIEFIHGIGFGKRITKLSSIKKSDEKTTLTGEIELWPEVACTFVIEVDSENIVRKAEIEQHNITGRIFRTIITTEGIIEQDGLRLAKSSTFKKLEIRLDDQGNPGPGIVKDDSKSQCKGVEVNLTKKRLAELSEFKIEPLMQVNDRIRGIRGTGPDYISKEIEKGGTGSGSKR